MQTGMLLDVTYFGSITGLTFELENGSQVTGYGHPRLIDDALNDIGLELPYHCEFDLDGAGLLQWFRPTEIDVCA